jgi:hypothetical protein
VGTAILRRIAPDLRRAKVIDVSFDVPREQKTGKTQVRLTALENMCKTTSPSSPDDEKHPENGSTQWVEAGEDSSVPTSPKLHPNFTQASPKLHPWKPLHKTRVKKVKIVKMISPSILVWL